MSEDVEERVRERAHAIWEAQGYPEGLDQQHWAQAEAEIANLNTSGQSDAELPNPLATGAAAEMLAKPKRRKAEASAQP